MAPRLLTFTLLAVGLTIQDAVLGISFNQIARCPIQSGIEHFNITNLCGKVFYATYVAGITGLMTCGLGTVQCSSDGTVVELTKSYFDGEQVSFASDKSTLTNREPGVVSIVIATKDGPIELKDIVVAYTQFANGEFNMAYLICSDTSDNDDKIRAAIISTNKEADLTAELAAIRKIYPNIALYSIPMQCPEINSIQW